MMIAQARAILLSLLLLLPSIAQAAFTTRACFQLDDVENTKVVGASVTCWDEDNGPDDEIGVRQSEYFCSF